MGCERRVPFGNPLLDGEFGSMRNHTLRTSLLTACFALGAAGDHALGGSPTLRSGEGENEPAEPRDGGSPTELPKLPGLNGGQYLGASDGIPFGNGAGVRPADRAAPKPVFSKPKVGPGKGPNGPGAARGASGRSARGIDGYGGKRSVRSNAEESWELWWELNAFRYLRIAVVSEEPTTPGGSMIALANDAVSSPAELARFSDATVRSRVLPVFEKLLATRESDLVEAAVIPYAQCVPLSDSGRGAATLIPLLSLPMRSAQAKTLIALGLTRSRTALPLLASVALDQKPGRTQLGFSSAIPDELRAAAALAIGEFHDPEAFRVLQGLIFDDKKAGVEARAMAVRALGGFSGQGNLACEALLEVLRDERLDDEIRAEAPLALRRLSDERAIPALLKVANSESTKARLAESCIIALGSLAAARDTSTVSLLEERATRDPSAQIRGLALMALGEIAERAVRDQPQANRAFTAELAAFLSSEIRKPSRTGNTPWAALATAIAARSLEDFDPVRRSVSENLAASYESELDASNRGAFAIAFGLLGNSSHAAIVTREFAKVEDHRVAGHLAVAVGMLAEIDASAELQARLLDSTDSALASGVTLGLAQLGTRGLSHGLLSALAASRNLNRIHDLSRSLGWLGDHDALTTLLAWVSEESVAKVVRVEICAALGALARRHGKDLRSDLLDVVNYRIDSTTLGRVLEVDI